MINQNKKQFSILLIGTQIAIGGAQKVLLDQARWFHQHNHKVFAVFLYDKEGLHSKWQAVSNFEIVDLKAFQKDKGGFVNGFSLVKGLYFLWRLLRREKIDVIQSFTHDSNILALPIAWLARVPVRIATHHGLIEGFPRWREKLNTWLVNHGIAHSLVAVSSKIKQQAILEGISAERVTVIKNGIVPLTLEGINKSRFRKEAELNDNDLFLISVGRLVYQKAHAVLIQSMPAILKDYPNLKLGICGDGFLRPNLEAQISKLGISDSVKLLGNIDNVNGFLAVADIFVLPSRWEGLPIALLEAMSAGLPVVATNVEGVDEVVNEGVHGFLTSVEDVGELTIAILKLLENPQLRVKMGSAGKAHILENYTEKIMCEQYFQLMMKLLQPNKG